MTYLIDIDGTIADCQHRLHFLDGSDFIPNPYAVFTPDWNAFFKACVDDKPIEPVLAHLKRIERFEPIVFVTGRSDLVYEETKVWLEKYDFWRGPIYMRKHGDYRPDHVVKSELVDEILKDFNFDPATIIAFEDRDQCVQMYRKRGIRCFQVCEGNF